MNKAITSDVRDQNLDRYSRPAVSLVLPFDPKMIGKPSLMQPVRNAIEEAISLLRKDFPAQLVDLMKGKFDAVVGKLNHATHTKSVAIYVSPVFEKILYLDFDVTPQVVVADSFDLKSLVFQKKQDQRFLVLALGGTQSRLFLGGEGKLVRILATSLKPVYAYVRDMPEMVANFSDPHEKREIVQDKMLHQLDNTLELVLKAYHLPLFIVGLPRLAGHFKVHTRHGNDILEYVLKNGEDITEAEILKLLQPHLSNWLELREKELLNKLSDALGKGRLVSGIKQVLQAANMHKGQMLVIEKGYLTGQKRCTDSVIFMPPRPYNRYSPVKDVLDDIIEGVFENGGDIEFVNNGLLENYGGMAIITYF